MKGRAFVFTGVQQPFEARDFPLPDVEPDAILVRVTVANICGSDLHGWHGRTPRSGPTVMADALDDLTLAPLNCALAQVIYGLHQAGFQPGETVVIQGAGGLGLFAAAVARERGAARVVVLDRIEERLKLAQAFGADHVLNVD